MAQLIARDAARSEYDPDIEAAAAAAAPIAIHPVTGAFSDPTHERAFAAHFFRLCFGAHIAMMLLYISSFTIAWTNSPIPMDATAWTTAWTTSPIPTLVAGVGFFLAALGLIGRVRIHQWDDTVRAQRVGAGIWTTLMMLTIASDIGGLAMAQAAMCEAATSVYEDINGGLGIAWTVLLNGSHGMGFAHKFGLICAMALECFCYIGACGLGWTPLAVFTGWCLAVFGLAHLAEMHMRHSYADKQRLEGKQRRLEVQINAETAESRRLEERNEQLRAEKERLMYDVQRRGNPLDDDDARSAIRRGLQAGPSPSYHRADSTDSRETGTSALSDSPLPSLPPGPPSSSAGKSSESGKSGEGMGGSDREGVVDRAAFSRAPPQARPPTWEELDAQFYAECAQKTASEPRTACLASAEADRHGPPPSSKVCRTSAAATAAAPLPPRPASRQAEIDELLDRRCAEMAAASTTEQAGARRARGTKREAAGVEVAQVKAGAGKASGSAAAVRARAAKRPTTEQDRDIEQLQSWQRSTDPVYVDARARLAAAEALMDAVDGVRR